MEIANAERRTPLGRPSLEGTANDEAAYAIMLSSNGPRYPSNHLIEKVTQDFTPPFLGLTAAVPLVRCAVASTRLPSTTVFGTSDLNDHPRSILNPSPPGSPLSSIPVRVADFLFENYMTRVVAQYPIFYSSDIIGFFNSVFHNPIPGLEPGALSTPYEIYVVSLVMAISLTTAARTQQVRANSIAAGLFKTAMQQIRTVCTNDLRGLQALLLLLQYTFLDPSAANLWFLSGFTTQACIDLGLHQEGPGDLETMDPLTRDIRRRVFWCAYEMEIATSAALLRPTSLLSKHINVPFPSDVQDSTISASGIGPNGRSTEFISKRIWQFRQVEAEIVSVLFHNGEIPPQQQHGNDNDRNSLEAWMHKMEVSINTWYDEVHLSAALNTDPTKKSQWEEMCLYADIARDYIIVTLFRPNPRVKEPRCENLMKAFIAGVGVADGYWKQSNLDFGNSKYVFHPCYHTFSGAVVFLQALQRCKDTIYLTYTVEEVENFISCFSRFFSTISERWPAASRCLEDFERLMAPVKREYIDFTVQKARSNSSNEAPSTDQGPAFVGYQDGLMDQAWAFDDTMLGFGSPFTPELWNTEEASGLSSSFPVPIDWNAEFDFGNPVTNPRRFSGGSRKEQPLIEEELAP
ncbi:hypothetical protein VTN00DRAFT_8402 [Thermoascus crustaceus]|uniref:uncharacterized protein n=1 Tax=Thermoascus crustaceus TaxID=5088 RepID=UPI0037420672